MKPTLESLKAACPGVPERLIEEHLSRLGERYFERFSEEEVRCHLQCLARVGPDSPVEVLVGRTGQGRVDCTVLGFDYPGVFSLMTGVLTGMGMNIVSGDVFTYRPARGGVRVEPRRGTRDRRGGRQELSFRRRRIVNHFSGVLPEDATFEDWSEELVRRFSELFGLLERGDKASVEAAGHRVNEMVVRRLKHLRGEEHQPLYPVLIEVDNQSTECTRLRIRSEDTPAFLYSLTHAFSLHDIYIEHVRIRTYDGRIEDEIDVVDARNRKIESPEVLSRIKLSVLLTKQFTYFLGKAPDPYAALTRFKHLVQDILSLPAADHWLATLSNPRALKDLAVLLGTSDYLWEDFIRLQYETLLPMLQPIVKGRRFASPPGSLRERLEEALRGAADIEEKRARLNAFKDREIFLIDLDHILDPEKNFRDLAERLTNLAEHVIRAAARFCYEHLVARYGRPRTAAGLEVEYAIMGLGKLGGAALGYASDIELLVVYGDNGQTDGQESITNAEFFNRLVQELLRSIRAKREGIFQVDLRLRPHGDAGPLASSLEGFCGYYGPGGPAHSYERLALVRLRAIGGSRALGARLERIRDGLLYESRSIDLGEIRAIREKQYREKTGPGTRNAKFSPGGLVDLEYNVQILQVMHGKENPRLRTPRLHEALAALADAGVLDPEETGRLLDAYAFLRRLINAMRMLRGSAKDLFLPSSGSEELEHLARRMGYRESGPLPPARQLEIEYETHTAVVRAFAERYFGRNSLPGPAGESVADLVLAEEMPQEVYRRILGKLGFQNPGRAYKNLRILGGTGSRRHTFAKLSLLVADVLSQSADPDMALNNWERFIRVKTSPEFHFNLLLSQPMRLEIMLKIFAGSQFLADTLVRSPGLLDWVVLPENLRGARKGTEIEEELSRVLAREPGHQEWLNQLRRVRRREMLRIGTRDIVLKVPTEEVMLELSTLAETLVRATLRKAWRDTCTRNRMPVDPVESEACFCILALGKLGGRELNYSSDIDLLGLVDPSLGRGQGKPGWDGEALRYLFSGVMERVGLDLSRHTAEGYAYRVDLRLRPHGRAGELVPSLSGLVDYYRRDASLWEIQAALKARPIAGNLDLGWRFCESLGSVLSEHRDRGSIIRSIERMRRASVRKASRALAPGWDVKSGEGGIRDVEFLVQGLQLVHGPDDPALLKGNTLEALEALGTAGILPADVVKQLREDYLFLRRVEHALQVLEDRQVHTVPSDPAERRCLARRVLGPEADEVAFLDALAGCTGRVRKAYTAYLLEGT